MHILAQNYPTSLKIPKLNLEKYINELELDIFIIRKPQTNILLNYDILLDSQSL